MKIDINNINNRNDHEFRDNILLERGIIEKFFKFHLEALNFSLENLIKGKNIDNESRSFTNYYLSIAYFLNPMFREEFIKQIYSNINLKDPRYIKFLKNIKKMFFFLMKIIILRPKAISFYGMIHFIKNWNHH